MATFNAINAIKNATTPLELYQAVEASGLAKLSAIGNLEIGPNPYVGVILHDPRDIASRPLFVGAADYVTIHLITFNEEGKTNSNVIKLGLNSAIPMVMAFLNY